MQVYQMILKYQAIKEKLENKRMPSTIDVNDVLKDLDNLDPFESYIPEVPVCVKEWYHDVQSDFYNSLDNLIRFCYRNTEIPICKWFINTEDAVKILINVHQFGFKINSSKRFIVKAKGLMCSEVYIGYNQICKEWILTNSKNSEIYRIEHTKEELDNSGFDELLSDPLWSIEEV